MLKRVNDTIEKFINTPLWLKLLICVLTMISFTLIGSLIIADKPDLPLFVKLSLVGGTVMGLFATLLFTAAKQSQVFWDLAKELEDKLDKADTISTLADLYYKELKVLEKKSMGTPHFSEVNRLHAILQTKYNCFVNAASKK